MDKREIVTLMTLGAAPEALAIGYLRNQRLVSSIEEIVAVQVDEAAWLPSLRGGIAGISTDAWRRTVTTGCGQARSSARDG